MTMATVKRLRWMIFGIVFVAGGVSAQVEKFEPVRTKEGCQIQALVTPFFASVDRQGRPLPISREHSWSGACVGGTAFGPGLFRAQTTSGSATLIEEKRITVDAGFPFGYEYSSTVSAASRTSYVLFRHGNQIVFFSDGWGLTTEPYARGVSDVLVPQLRAVDRISVGMMVRDHQECSH